MADFLVIGPLAGLLGSHWTVRFGRLPCGQLPAGQQNDLPGQRPESGRHEQVGKGPMVDFLVIGPLAGLLGRHLTVRFGRLPCGQLG